MSDEPRVPEGLERFGRVLVRRLHVLQRRRQRRRLIVLCAVASALLAGSAIAATHALDDRSDGDRIGPETFVLDPAALLYGQYQRELRQDMLARDVLLTLPVRAGGLAGSDAYVTHMQGGGSCLRVENQVRCGPDPDARSPVLGIVVRLIQPNAPYVYLGIEAADVTRHVIRCGRSSRDVTSNAGHHVFLYVSARGVDPAGCTQATMAGRRTVTSLLPQ